MSNNNTSDYNLTKISSKELGENLRGTIEYGGNIFILGRRGSSKTFQAKQAIKDMVCNGKLPHQIYPLSWLIKKFAPIKGWSQEQIDKLPSTL